VGGRARRRDGEGLPVSHCRQTAHRHLVSALRAAADPLPSGRRGQYPLRPRAGLHRDDRPRAVAPT
jgi:hypothetical protein